MQTLLGSSDGSSPWASGPNRGYLGLSSCLLLLVQVIADTWGMSQQKGILCVCLSLLLCFWNKQKHLCRQSLLYLKNSLSYALFVGVLFQLNDHKHEEQIMEEKGMVTVLNYKGP